MRLHDIIIQQQACDKVKFAHIADYLSEALWDIIQQALASLPEADPYFATAHGKSFASLKVPYEIIIETLIRMMKGLSKEGRISLRESLESDLQDMLQDGLFEACQLDVSDSQE